MGQVTLTTAEYLELVDDARKYHELRGKVYDMQEVIVDKEGRVTVDFNLNLDEKVVKHWKDKLISAITSNTAAMDYLASHGEHYRSFDDRHFDNYKWGASEDYCVISDEFQAAYTEAEARQQKALEEQRKLDAMIQESIEEVADGE